jgi:multisubunit Na+/H+ antiporter MnhF subunit
MSQYMLVICFISIYFNFFEKFLGYHVPNSIVSIYHIRNSIVSTVHNVLCTSGSAIYFNCLKSLAGHDHPKVSTSEPDKFFVLLTQSFVKFEDKIRVINFEPIEIYLSLIILHYLNTNLLMRYMISG